MANGVPADLNIDGMRELTNRLSNESTKFCRRGIFKLVTALALLAIGSSLIAATALTPDLTCAHICAVSACATFFTVTYFSNTGFKSLKQSLAAHKLVLISRQFLNSQETFERLLNDQQDLAQGIVQDLNQLLNNLRGMQPVAVRPAQEGIAD